MSILFEGVSVDGIVEPGQFYMLFDGDCGSVEGEIDLMYFIRSEDELLRTLEMEMQIVLRSMYPIRKFIGVSKIKDDRYEFEFLCKSSDEEEIERCMYLHRLKPYGEMLERMRKVFSAGSEKGAALSGRWYTTIS